MSNEMEDKLKKYKAEFLSYEDEIDNIQQSQKIKSDYDYFNQVIERSKTSSFDFRIILTSDRTIHGHFIQALSLNLYSVKEIEVRHLLNLYSITKSIFEVKDYDRRTELLIEWKPVLEYYSGVNLYEHLGNFIGCSQTLEAVTEDIQIMEGYNSVYK